MANKRPADKTRTTRRTRRPRRPPGGGDDPSASADAAAARLEEKTVSTELLARSIPFNATMARECGRRNALNPAEGQANQPSSYGVTASTITESEPGSKTEVAATPGENPNQASPQRVRVDSSDRALTTNQGVAISDNQSSLKAGLRGPTLVEDLVLREKITHFDHERIPERVVHARGSAAHGYFECYEALTDLTMTSTSRRCIT
jgi:catalase